MINITLADGYTEKQLMKEVKDRANETDKKITAAVSEIIDNVRLNGDKAVKEYTIKSLEEQQSTIAKSAPFAHIVFVPCFGRKYQNSIVKHTVDI